MEKIDGKTKDLMAENRDVLVEMLQDKFPEVVSEGEVDLVKLSELLGRGGNLDTTLERYNFTWAGKSEAIRNAMAQSSGTLRASREDSVNWDTTENIYIEGDNLEVLKLLQKSYSKSIKMIYIDPPYNTGNDFVYKDDFKDNIKNYLEITGQVDSDGKKLSTNTETSGRYHSDWLNMMYPRLKLARNLLKDDGVIFISIDDNEVSNLRKLCDEIFGEENFRNQIVVRRGAKSVQSQFDTWDKLGQDIEYLLFYTKDSNYRFPKQTRKLQNEKTGSWNNHWRGSDRPTMRYPLLGITPEKGQWRWSKERSLFAIENYKAMLDELNETNDSITQEKIDNYYSLLQEEKDLLRLSKTGKPEHYIPPTDSTLLNSSWYDLLIGSSAEISSLFDSKVFDTAKLTQVLSRILNFGEKDSTILDFFSGSATTAHAVMQLNKEDGGNRKFICVQLQEQTDENSEAFKAGYKNICEIGKERIRRVIKKLEAESPAIGNNQDELNFEAQESPKTPLDLGFKVFKLDSSNFSAWDTDPNNLTEDTLLKHVNNIKENRSTEDILYELLLKLGEGLNTPYIKVKLANKTVFDIADGSILACLDDDLDMQFCENLIAYHETLFPKTDEQDPTRTQQERKEDRRHRLETTAFIFKDSNFKDDVTKSNIIQTLRQLGFENIKVI